MKIGSDPPFELTYCTNIHPANGWPDVFANLERYAPRLKARLAPDRPFGLGLRLSDAESRELLEGSNLERFQGFLAEQGLYVFTLNGFPYGTFHRQPLKDQVYAPDWQEEARVEYTLHLIEILSRLLPPGTEGSISTSPLSYKPWLDGPDAATWQRLTRNVARVAAALARLARERGTTICLAFEPEPDGLLENSEEVVRFFADRLLPIGAPLLAGDLGVSTDDACRALLQHVGVCLDTCHMAVAYEDASAVVDRLAAAGIRVGKLQISSALQVRFPPDPRERPPLVEALRPFDEPVYLHQVGQRNRDGGLRRYRDLDRALVASAEPELEEWRIHFHSPIFVERYATFGSTQEQIRRTLTLLRGRPFTRHLEIETYTWDVLPPDVKRDLFDSIAREYEWVLDVFDH